MPTISVTPSPKPSEIEMVELAVSNASAVARCIVSGTLLCYRLMLQHVHAEVYIVHFWFSGCERHIIWDLSGFRGLNALQLATLRSPPCAIIV
jgi:hypothetical protein